MLSDSDLSQMTMTGSHVLNLKRSCHFFKRKNAIIHLSTESICYNVSSTGSDVNLIVVTQIQLWWLSALPVLNVNKQYQCCTQHAVYIHISIGTVYYNNGHLKHQSEFITSHFWNVLESKYKGYFFSRPEVVNLDWSLESPGRFEECRGPAQVA